MGYSSGVSKESDMTELLNNDNSVCVLGGGVGVRDPRCAIWISVR